MSSKHGIDLGDVPDSVQEEAKRLEALLEEDGEEAKDLIHVDEQGLVTVMGEEPAKVAARPAPKKKLTRAQIDFADSSPDNPGFKLEFDVVDYSITEYNLTLSIGSDFFFEPKGTMQVTVTIGGKSYPVMYVGASFKLESIGLCGISFLRRNNPPNK